MLKAFWFLSSNFGDALNHYILSRLSRDGVAYIDVSDRDKKVVAIGSILNWCNENCIAWGPGLANRQDQVNPQAEIRAVRGPLSRQRALECGASVPEVYGDPALLLPLLYRPPSRKKFSLGIIPHYIDQAAVMHRYKAESKEIRIIDVLDTPERVIDEIVSCDRIVSSSLHGIIVAHAYHIPAAWLKFGEKIGGDDMKYVDYFLSVDCAINVPIACHDLPSPREILARAEHHFEQEFLINTSPLLGCCPFELVDL
ncbi:polysaccharide pyruvyl transferase family protein [Methylococcus sp. EFPC2]|uniref:polysaccharide pyruvyl transferase family protein n=1 Tax=Methylococcus sp. EFPC2 TaxID=2812648 RepID=UPI0019688508|nr:polysaccharide pyruvyl transferase family protein [Methylococcus sp. EFPC2]QSA96822.1 polysaccharide pyruvyl transferase family protein [Methylococcus sp. EFPC2]